MCYTNKSNSALTENEIITFVHAYKKVQNVESITLCGGEVFLLPYISSLINLLTQEGIFIQIITNGSIDRLSEIQNPNNCNIILSLDGLPKYHDANRGKGMMERSCAFFDHACALGFHQEIFSIVTQQNYSDIPAFESWIQKKYGSIPITYHPRKPLKYLEAHPVNRCFSKKEGFDFLEGKDLQTLFLTKKTFPPKELGCYQIALQSDKRIYACCEGTTPIGALHDSIQQIIKNFKALLDMKTNPTCTSTCLGCVYPEFRCGFSL